MSSDLIRVFLIVVGIAALAIGLFASEKTRDAMAAFIAI